MSTTDNFEALSNAELRQKCKEHGLPNVPVTDSSRSVLIKKLRATISGSPSHGSKKTNSRRETIHSSKLYPSLDEVKAAAISKNDTVHGSRSPGRNANRRTIAATPSTTISGAVGGTVSNKEKFIMEPLVTASAIPLPVTVRRRSVREQQQQQSSHRPTADDPQSIIIEDDEEEDLMMAAAANKAEHFSFKPTDMYDAQARARSSRSSSLSKTGVLTTSYVQETVPLVSSHVPPPTAPLRAPVLFEEEEMDEDDAEDGELIESDGSGEVIVSQRSTGNTNFYNRYSTGANVAPLSQLSTSKLNTNSYGGTTQAFNNPIGNSRYTIGGTSTLTNTKTSTYNNMLSQPQQLQQQQQQQQHSPPLFKTQSTKPAPSFLSSTTTMRSATSAMPPPASLAGAGRYSSAKASYYADHEDDTDTNNEEDAAAAAAGGFNTPYLSDFARTLERMKAEPLSGSKPISRFTRSNKVATAYETPGRRPKLNDETEVTLADVLMALDSRYKIKRNFLILCLLLLLVFLFVLFWK